MKKNEETKARGCREPSPLRTASYTPAWSELPEPEKVRLEIPSIIRDKAGADCLRNSLVPIHVEGSWQISCSAWK